MSKRKKQEGQPKFLIFLMIASGVVAFSLFENKFEDKDKLPYYDALDLYFLPLIFIFISIGFGLIYIGYDEIGIFSIAVSPIWSLPVTFLIDYIMTRG